MTASAAFAPRLDGGVLVADALASVAQELERTRMLGLRVECAVIALAVNSAVDGAIVGELQHLDAMLQQIAGLRDFMTHLATRCDGSHRLDMAAALDRVTLEDMRARLSGADAAESDDGWELL